MAGTQILWPGLKYYGRDSNVMAGTQRFGHGFKDQGWAQRLAPGLKIWAGTERLGRELKHWGRNSKIWAGTQRFGQGLKDWDRN